MVDHLIAIAIVALAPLGAWVAMGEGMVLHGLSKWAEKLPAFIAKPIATCPRCMCSVWGIPCVLLAMPDVSPWALPVYLLAGCGLQEIIHR
jgi:hypothetical protein